MIRFSKAENFKSMCSTTDDLFGTLRKLTSRGSNPFPTAICSSGFTHTDTVAILKEFGKAFFPPSIPSTATHCELENNCNAFISKPIECFDPVSVAELGNAMSELKLDQSPGQDGCPAAWLHLRHPVIQPYLLFLFNACIATGYFPETWRSAKVTILRKEHKPSYDVTSSYRPISILCALSKMCRSTESAGLILARLIEHRNQGRLFTACAFLDIKSAIDSAWQLAILNGLIEKGCPFYLIKIIESFLYNRKGILSGPGEKLIVDIDLGCPQGSTLSPFCGTS